MNLFRVKKLLVILLVLGVVCNLIYLQGHCLAAGRKKTGKRVVTQKKVEKTGINNKNKNGAAGKKKEEILVEFKESGRKIMKKDFDIEWNLLPIEQRNAIKKADYLEIVKKRTLFSDAAKKEKLDESPEIPKKIIARTEQLLRDIWVRLELEKIKIEKEDVTKRMKVVVAQMPKENVTPESEKYIRSNVELGLKLEILEKQYKNKNVKIKRNVQELANEDIKDSIVLAEVGEKMITIEIVENKFPGYKELLGKKGDKENLVNMLDKVILGEIFIAEAKGKGLDDTDEYKVGRVSIEDQVRAEEYLFYNRSKVMEVSLTKEDLNEFYQKNKAGFEPKGYVWLRHIYIPLAPKDMDSDKKDTINQKARDEAGEVFQKLKEGQKIEIKTDVIIGINKDTDKKIVVATIDDKEVTLADVEKIHSKYVELSNDKKMVAMHNITKGFFDLFSELAAKHSKSPRASYGGYLEPFKEGKYSNEFEAAIFYKEEDGQEKVILPPGEIKLIEIPEPDQAIHIIKRVGPDDPRLRQFALERTFMEEMAKGLENKAGGVVNRELLQ
ncbi:MAG: hypothetical protein V1872_08075 [bacterium]